MPSDKWLQTALMIDGVPQEPVTDTATVTFGTKNATYIVVFGNIPTGYITACKFYDSDVDGERDIGENGTKGVKITLTGRDVLADLTDPPITGNNVEIVAYTGPDGCFTFESLLPGKYTVSETPPPITTSCKWVSTTPIASQEIILACEEDQEESVDFGNVITDTVCFSTKGYWHNKNGLDELDQDDINYANGKAPYSSPSTYFDDGDEPFDGFFFDGTPVEAAYNVHSNGDGGPREQLAQQLLAFIFNVRNRLDVETAVILETGLWEGPAGDLIAEAIAAWEQNIDPTLWNDYKDILDGLNKRECDPGVEYALPSRPEGCVPVKYSE